MSDTQILLSDDMQQPVHNWCGTPLLHQYLLATVPGYKSARQFVEQFNHVARQAPSLRTSVSQIPVVVHVVWNKPDQNISQTQIDSQISVLNEDFNAANSDLGNLPAAFRPLVGNLRIRFFLAKRDPKGKPTTGVTRTQTAIVSFDHNSATDPPDQRVKFTAQGGADGWPSDRYLNIWVCKQGGVQPLLGFAQFPGLPAATDGVVISHTAFGKGGRATSPFELGRTATHEIGHWLNLYHIWGDDGGGPAGLLCSGTDLCDDTPNQAGANRGNPTFPHITCGNGPNGDLFMNYMDYTNDATTIMFTKAQVARMDATLSGPRASLAGPNFQNFILHTGTALHITDETFAFAMTDWNGDGRPDLVAIKKSNTGTNTTEVHILSGASNFQDFILHTGTALHITDETFAFAMTDWNGDGRPDLVAIKKSNTGTNTTEVHILSGASNFQNFILHTGTALHNTDETFAFAMTDWNGDGRPDLVAIKKSNTGTNTTEVHILSGVSNFQDFILHTGTALHNTDETFAFAMTDWNSDGHSDLIAIEKSSTGTNSTEILIFSGALNYQNLLTQTSTALHNTDKSFDFAVTDWDGTGRPDLVAIKKRNTGTNSTEVHIIAG
ncbi:hypothetical protein BDV29DRAFT_163766 [Aspergillus leporis]|uniref:Peptidase M43 pregnancy-associated plasma-A domain-containing protein n=1 Tax=Aspergillus leporis TaxID=41062 RepID=A0A5N5WFZ2_9EURO|nr:hypothetical protein BDV29DRAFT_163766 [Aspergillus leporis]